MLQEYIRDETLNLRRELLRAQEEVKRIQAVPLVIGQFLEAVDEKRGIVGSTTGQSFCQPTAYHKIYVGECAGSDVFAGQNYVVRILSTLDRELLKPSASVALHRHSNALVDILPPEADSSISMLGSDEKPDVKYSDIGGMDMQKQEIREAVELPLVQVSARSRTSNNREFCMFGAPSMRAGYECVGYGLTGPRWTCTERSVSTHPEVCCCTVLLVCLLVV